MHDKFLAVVKVLDEYEIPIHGLKEGIHRYEFILDSPFFEYFNNPDLPGGKLNAEVSLQKRPQFLEFEFNISGTLSLFCDRCLEIFDYELVVDEKLFVRFGNTFEELDDNIIIIPWEESRFNIAQYLYEFAVLNVPYKKIHPETADGISGCNPEMIKRLNELKAEDIKQENTRNDPRWDILKNLN